MRDGWFHTGDLGRCDEDGYFYYLGRLKDVIRVGGENVSSQELESIADSHPDVAGAAAVAVPGEISDDDILLYVEPIPGTVLSEDDLHQFLKDRAALFMLPRYILKVDRLPRTPTQKIRKSDLSRVIPHSAWTRPRSS
jgi:crotonobetaine/carnitine-CoA ligase